MTNKIRRYILIVATYLVSLTCLVFYIIPMAPTLLDQKKAIDELTARKIVLAKKASVLGQIDASLYKRYLVALETALPSRKTVDGILTQLEQAKSVQAATGSGLIIQSFSVNPGEVASPSAAQIADNSIALNLSLVSDQPSLIRYLQNIYLLPRFIKVDSLQGLSQSVAQPGVSYTTNLILKAYYYPPLNNLGPVEQPLEDINDMDLALITNYISKTVTVSNQPYATPSGKTNPFVQ